MQAGLGLSGGIIAYEGIQGFLPLSGFVQVCHEQIREDLEL